MRPVPLAFLSYCTVALTVSVLSLQGQADLLKHARAEVLENLKQVHYAALTCDLAKGVTSSSSESRSRRSLGAIPERGSGEDIADDVEEN